MHRMLASLPGLFVGVSALASTLAPAEVYSRLITQARVDVLNKDDPFTKPIVEDGLIGQNLRVSLRVYSDKSDGRKVSNGFYSYDGSRLAIYLSLGPILYGTPHLLAQETPSIIYGPSYTASNAFGVTRRIERWDVHKNGIELTNVRTDRQGLASLIFESDLPANEARGLAASAVFVLEGTVTKKANGKIASCERLRFPPELQRPIMLTMTNCEVGARVDRVQLVDTRSHSVLKAWSVEADGLLSPTIDPL